MLPFLDLSAKSKKRCIFILWVWSMRFRFWIMTLSSEEATLNVSCMNTPFTFALSECEQGKEPQSKVPCLPAPFQPFVSSMQTVGNSARFVHWVAAKISLQHLFLSHRHSSGAATGK